MSQSDAQQYRQHVRADLGDEVAAHDPQACDDCRDKRPCRQLYYADRAAELVEYRLQRRPFGGPS